MKFGRKVLESYLAVVIVILTLVVYVVLAGVGTPGQSQFSMLLILIIILISVNVLNAIIALRILEGINGLLQRDTDDNGNEHTAVEHDS